MRDLDLIGVGAGSDYDTLYANLTLPSALPVTILGLYKTSEVLGSTMVMH